MAQALNPEARPRLARGVRLHADPIRGYVLLAPERVLNANPFAVEILKCCDGARTLVAIVDELAMRFSGERTRIATDVDALLGDLADKRMVEL